MRKLIEFDRRAILSRLPNMQRRVPSSDDRRMLNSIHWILRSGASCNDCYCPRTTCSNRFARW
ncbi:hypothetical protein B0E33_18645 [Roseibium algicola]|uniref:Uncharacterized protein n=1 Tax=Roseibium algicola TaxID=2857014 RepID=A0ABN4X154_9HYPH|nr:hypothetical protein B0E33_18645 [Roseibium aggregatum]